MLIIRGLQIWVTKMGVGVASSGDQCGGYRRILFRYEVQADDGDADDIGIAADALTLNGGTIRNRAGTDVDLDLGNHTITNAEGHKVRGGG